MSATSRQLPGAWGGQGAPLPRRGRSDQGIVDRGQGDLSRRLLSSRKRDDGAKAGAEAAAADLDGGRPPRRAAPYRTARRWLDGLGRVEQGGLRRVRADPEGDAGGAGARPE